MARNPTPVLFTHFGDDWVRGSEVALLDLIASLDRDRFEPIVWCNAAAMEAACKEAGLTTYRSRFEFFFDYDSPRPDLGRYRQLIRTGREICRRHGIALIHANGAAPVQWLVPVARGERLPLLAHLHAPYLRRSRYVLLLHAATMIVGVSKAVVAPLLADGVPAEKVKVIYNGVKGPEDNPSPRDFRAELAIPRGDFVVASAGSFIRRKGHDILLRAFATLPDDSRLLLASDGPERMALLDLASDLGVASRVHMVGHLPGLTPLFRAANVFALATRSEAFGLVLAEAGANALAVVSTTVDGIPEVVVDGETGLLSSAGDVDALAANLRRLREDPILARRLGDAGRERAASLFDLRRMAVAFEELYEELIALPRRELGWGDFVARYARLLGRARR